MQTPAVYDLQTEKLAHPDERAFTVGTEADVRTPIAQPWGNRGGIGNIQRLLADVESHHARVSIEPDGARIVPQGRTATVYVDRHRVEDEGRRLRSGETVVLGRGKSDLWEGYRLQLFF
ncbi:MAG: FHA domain-containing protein [Halodesulfurarchaeum sp.]